MCNFLVYAFCRKDGTFYYIGKGSKNRAYSKRQSGIKPPQDKSRILILHSGLDEQTAFLYESLLIQFYGRKDLGTGLLRNLTNGGEGVAGWVPSESWRKQKSLSMAGKNNPFFGRKHTNMAKTQISIANKGRHKGSKNPMYGRRLTGKSNPMYGKSRPDLSERNKKSSPCSGTKWYNNGEYTVRCKPGDQPDGFVLGRLRKKN